MNTKLNYTLVWKECVENSELAKRFYVPGFIGYLPFFLEGDDVSAGHQVNFSEEQLLKGIMYGLWEFQNGGNKPWHTENGRKTFLHLLDILGNGFKFSSPEEMFLNVAYNVRSQHGNVPSYKMLESGLQLIPFSSKIRSDLVCDLWDIAAAEDEEEDVSGTQKEMLKQILIYIDEIKMQDIQPEPREIVCYLGMYALILLERPEETLKYLEKSIFPNIKSKVMIDKVMFLSMNPEKASLVPLKNLI